MTFSLNQLDYLLGRMAVYPKATRGNNSSLVALWLLRWIFPLRLIRTFFPLTPRDTTGDGLSFLELSGLLIVGLRKKIALKKAA